MQIPQSANVYMLESQRDNLLAAIATRGEGNEKVLVGPTLDAIGVHVWRVPIPIGDEGTTVRDIATDGYAVLVLLTTGRLLLFGYTATRQIHPEFYVVLPAQPSTRVCRITFGAQHITCIAMHTHDAISNFQQDRHTLWPVLPAAPLF
jgi:hypothetical protein